MLYIFTKQEWTGLEFIVAKMGIDMSNIKILSKYWIWIYKHEDKKTKIAWYNMFQCTV